VFGTQFWEEAVEQHEAAIPCKAREKSKKKERKKKKITSREHQQSRKERQSGPREAEAWKTDLRCGEKKGLKKTHV
jgi:hypothetical protein